MEFCIVKDVTSLEQVVHFRGSFTERDIASLRLDKLDRALLDDVGSDQRATAADILLALEVLFRRHAEQHGAPGKEGS